MRNDKLPEENAESERTPDSHPPPEERPPLLMALEPPALFGQRRLDPSDFYYYLERHARVQASRVARVAPTMAPDIANAVPTIIYPTEQSTRPRPLSHTFRRLINPAVEASCSAAAAGTAANSSSAATPAAVDRFSSAAAAGTAANFSSAAAAGTAANFSSAATPAAVDRFSSAAAAAGTAPSTSRFPAIHSAGSETSHSATYSSASSDAATHPPTPLHYLSEPPYCIPSTSKGFFGSYYGSPTVSNSDTDSATSAETATASVIHSDDRVSRRRRFDEYNDEDMEELRVPHKVAKRSEQRMMVYTGEGGGNLGNGGNGGDGGDRGDPDDGDGDMMMDCASPE